MKNHNLDLIDFLSLKAGIPISSINYNSLIEDDLGITGDDAEELIIEFSKRFKVNINDFKFSDYFNSEPSIFIASKNIKLLTVKNLAEAITYRRLDEDIINLKHN